MNSNFLSKTKRSSFQDKKAPSAPKPYRAVNCLALLHAIATPEPTARKATSARAGK